MGIRKMQGTASHLEYIGPKGRKKRSSCAYYKNSICYYSKSSTYMTKCVGRIYCQFFDDSDRAKENYKNELNEVNSYKLGKNNTIEKRKKGNSKRVCSKKDNSKIDEYTDVTLLSLETGELVYIQIVSDEEANPIKQKYSERSVMARKIRFNWIGSSFSLSSDGKRKKYKIVDIK